MPSVLAAVAAAACYNFCGRWQQTVADSFRYLSFHQSNGRHSQWVESETESRGSWQWGWSSAKENFSSFNFAATITQTSLRVESLVRLGLRMSPTLASSSPSKHHQSLLACKQNGVHWQDNNREQNCTANRAERVKLINYHGRHFVEQQTYTHIHMCECVLATINLINACHI